MHSLTSDLAVADAFQNSYYKAKHRAIVGTLQLAEHTSTTDENLFQRAATLSQTSIYDMLHAQRKV